MRLAIFPHIIPASDIEVSRNILLVIILLLLMTAGEFGKFSPSFSPDDFLILLLPLTKMISSYEIMEKGP